MITDLVREKRTPRGRWVALSIVALILVALGGYWLVNPRKIGDYGDRMEVPVSPGTTVYVGFMVKLASGHAASIDLTSVRPRVANNSADAEIRVLLCTIGTGPIGATYTTSGSCSTTAAFHSGTVTIGQSRGQVDVLLAVTPRHTGSVKVLGVDVRYHDGIRIGSAHSGLEVDVTASAQRG